MSSPDVDSIIKSELKTILARISVVIGCLLLPIYPAVAGDPCVNAYSSNVAVLSGWGAAYDVFLSTHPLLAAVDCTTSGTPLTIGDNSGAQYVYRYAYTSPDGTTWAQVSLTSNGPASGGWYRGQASANLSLSDNDLQGQTYIAFLVAHWTGTQWLFGCADLTCANPGWSLQSINRPALAMSFSPSTPSALNTIALGSTIAIVNVTWSSGQTFSGHLSFGPPDGDASGRFSIAADRYVIVNSNGPGLSGDTGTTQNVTIVATQ